MVGIKIKGSRSEVEAESEAEAESEVESESKKLQRCKNFTKRSRELDQVVDSN
jgi:hypothetical protein